MQCMYRICCIKAAIESVLTSVLVSGQRVGRHYTLMVAVTTLKITIKIEFTVGHSNHTQGFF